MAINFSKYQYLVDEFNQRYGVDFSYSDFETEVMRKRYIAESRSKISEENQEYVNRFTSLFDKAFTNSVDRKIDAFTAEEIVNDYNRMMNGYSDAYKDNGTPLKQNWVSGSALLKEARDEMEDVKLGKQAFIEEEYLSGALRIRDMRRYAKELQKVNETSPKKLSAIWNYANALQKVNDERPRWWRRIHFIRNAAEKREAENMRNFVTERLQAFDKINGEGSGMREMMVHLSDPTIIKLKDSIETAYASAKKAEKDEKLKAKLKAEESKKGDLAQNEQYEEKEISLEDETVREKIGYMIENDLKESLLRDDKSKDNIGKTALDPEEKHVDNSIKTTF